jgi:hypothetical protein
MNRIPVLISAALITVGGSAAIWLATACIGLKTSEIISAEIALLGTLGALISAAYVVCSYLQTNMAYRESQRPQLLVQIESQNLPVSLEDPTIVPLSLVHYRNITNNQFKDLNINLLVHASNRIIDISDLFKRNMTMIGHDSRVRRFRPDGILLERGVDIQSIASAGNEVILKIGYDYSFFRKTEKVECQDYKWDPNLQQWLIP